MYIEYQSVSLSLSKARQKKIKGDIMLNGLRLGRLSVTTLMIFVTCFLVSKESFPFLKK